MPLSSSVHASPSHPSPPVYIKDSLLWLMAIACGLCAGSNYFNQPLLHSIAVAFGVTEVAVTMTVTFAQVSYAIGLLLLVPLGDKFERRQFVVWLMLLASCGLFVSGFSSDLFTLSIGIIVTGLFTVAAQVLVPMAATLSDPKRSGRAVGILMGGLLTGILVARSVAGILSEIGGWNTVYYVSGVVMVVVALILWRQLPTSRNVQDTSYMHIMRSLWTLMVAYPRLRTRAMMGGLAFSSVSVLFATTTLLLSGPDYGYSDAWIGLIGLMGVAGALMANVAGRLSDSGQSRLTTKISIVLMVLSWFFLLLGEKNIWWFLFGTLIIDGALQGINISNQGIVYKLLPEARSRINAIYMTAYFIGAASGSALASIAWHYGGWTAACLVGALIAALCGVVFAYDVRLANKAGSTV